MISDVDQLNALIHIRDNHLDKNKEFSISDVMEDPYIVFIFSTRKTLLNNISSLVKSNTLNKITQFKYKFAE
jgi:hypothetical protein